MSIPNERFMMNSGVLTEEDMISLTSKRVAIIGLGGLGGNIANQLVRLGVKHFILIDYDMFTTSNLNRQLFSNLLNIGKYKVDVVKEELVKINDTIDISVYIDEIENVKSIDCDYLIDCVDNFETRVYLSKLSKKLDVPLLHGSCGGWYGQVGWISPTNTLLEEIYKTGEGLEKELLNPVFAPTVVSSYMVSEFVKMIKGSDTMIINKLLMIDLYNNSLLITGR